MKKEFHHIGIPTTKKHPDEIYLAGVRLFITDATKSEHRIEWLRVEADSSLPAVLRTTAHVAYTVENLDEALAGQKVIAPPFAPFDGLRVAFVLEGEAPVEFLEFKK